MQEIGADRSPINVFFSYAHADEPYCQQLLKHLSHLQHDGKIAGWHDRLIDAGTDWSEAVDQAINSASIILLLVSPDFLISDYCYRVEVKLALEHQARGEARVIPIILRPCDWTSTPFAHLQCLPRNRKPVSTWENQDEAFAAIARELSRTIEHMYQSPSTPPFSKIEAQNRTRLLKRVRQTWIAGVLDHSLHRAARIVLDLQDQPDALANPWRLEVRETYLPPRPLPTDIPVEQHYDEADGELLILGEPGAGKTTLLLDLARVLIERAGQEEQPRVPVIFNLSSWAAKRPSLANWLVEELRVKYYVPEKVAQAWIDARQIIPDVVLQGSYEAQQRQVFATYVERMLVRRRADTRYTREQTLHWLTWLARQLVQHNQTEFYLERMQPTYLNAQPARLRFYRPCVKASVVLVSALLAMLIFAVTDTAATFLIKNLFLRGITRTNTPMTILLSF